MIIIIIVIIIIIIGSTLASYQINTQLQEFLLSRLTKNNYNVKYKCLVIIKVTNEFDNYNNNNNNNNNSMFAELVDQNLKEKWEKMLNQ